MPKLAVVGSINMDLVIQSPKIPQPGETVLSSASIQQFPGGKGANQAVAAARLGATVKMIGRVGDDSYGRNSLASLKDSGVDTSHIATVTEASTGVALIVVDEAAENTIVVASGANRAVETTDVVDSVIAEADTVLLQLEIPLAVNIHVARLAKAHGTRVILNPAPAQALPTDLLKNVDIIVPNEGECTLLAGYKIHSQEDYLPAAQALQKQGPGTVVMTLGANGAYVLYQDTASLVPAFSIEAKDTTAAGDAFVAGLAVALAEGQILSEAVRCANAAGALTATKPGAQPSLPSRNEWRKMVESE